MRKLTYLAIFEPTQSGYSVYFPDLPGCISCGVNFEDARQQAAEALSLHIDEIPVPSKMPQVDLETAAGYLISPITIFPDLGVCATNRFFKYI